MRRFIISVIISAVLLLGFIPSDSFAVPNKGNAVRVSAVKIAKVDPNHTFVKGERLKLTASVTPIYAKNKKLVWKSSKPSVVSVSKKGVIKAKKNGKAVITAKAKDGSRKKASVTITVGKRISSVEGKNVGTNLTMTKGEAKTFTVDIKPENAKKKAIKWSSSDPKIATVSKKGRVEAKRTGTVNIYAKSLDGGAVRMKCKVIVGVKVADVIVTGAALVMENKPSKLIAEVIPADASDPKLIWTSSDPEVVTVSSSGKVTYVSDGTAVVSAASRDGSNKVAGIIITSASLSSASAKFIAHRGVSSEAPENTVPAFELACQKGFWGVECDVWESAADDDAPGYNRELIVSHDNSLMRMSGIDASVTELTPGALKGIAVTGGANADQYTELKMLSLDEYLGVIGSYPDVNAVIELKFDGSSWFTDEGLDKVIELIDKHGMRGRATIISFSADILERVKQRCGAGIGTMYLVGNVTVQYTGIDACIEWAKEKGIETLSLQIESRSAEVITRIRSSGLTAGIWTENNPFTAYETVRDSGVDFITTDKLLFHD
jgi:glycerophosphoryl diester phosphodiesterase